MIRELCHIAKNLMMILSICGFCFLLAGCSSQNTSYDDESPESSIENKLPDISDIEPVVKDNWSDSIGRETKNTSADELSFEIKISEPMVLAIDCVTESEKLDIEIKNPDGEKIFSESDIQTERFETSVDSSGTYKVVVNAKQHTGSFWITPKK